MKLVPALAVPLVFCLGCGTIASQRPPAAAEGGRFAPLVPLEALAAAGGGRPGTGYPGVGLSWRLPGAAELASGLGLDFSYTHSFRESLSVGLVLGLFANGVELGAGDGTLRTVSLGASLAAGRPFGEVRWYAGMGLGWWLNRLSGIAGEGISDCPAWSLFAGAEIPLSVSLDLDIEVRYSLAQAGLDTGGQLALNALALRTVFVFRF